MLFPWTAFALLAIESANVINLRLAKVAGGGPQALEEVRLMFAEKAHAASEAASGLIMGGTPSGMIARYRFHVAENQARLVS